MLIAREITENRIVGDGVHFDLHDDDTNSAANLRTEVTADSDDDSEAPNERLKAIAKKRSSSATSSVAKRRVIPMDDHLRAVQVEWREFVQQLDREIQRQGFVLVTAHESRFHPGVLVPAVEDIGYYQVMMRYIPINGWEYAAVWKNLSDDQSAVSGMYNDNEVDHGILMVPSPPDELGNIRSPLAAVAGDVEQLHGLMDSFGYGFYWMAHPIFAPQMGATNKGVGSAKAAESGLAAPPYGSASFIDLMRNQESAERYKRLVRRSETEERSEDAYHRHLRTLSEHLHQEISCFQYARSDVDATVEMASDANAHHAIAPPWLQEYHLDNGEALAAAPRPSIPPNVNDHINGLARRVFLGLGVQPQLVALEHANHAANSDIAFAGQNESILNRQRTLEPLLAEAFRFVYAVILDMTAAHLDRPKESPSGSAENVVRHANTSNGSLSHRIRARLCNTPITTMEALHQMYMTGCITHEDYKSMTLQAVGVHAQMASNERMTRQQVAELQHGGKRDAASTKHTSSQKK